MPIRIEDRATGNITTIEAPTESNQVIVYSDTSGSSAKPAPVVITDDAEFQRVGSGEVDLFVDADTTAINAGSSTTTVNVQSDNLTLATAGATVDINGVAVTIADDDAELNLKGDTVNITTSGVPGTTTTISGKTINIGEADSAVNIIGSVSNQSVTNLNVTDKLITLNDGGAVGSGNGSGIEVEENGIAEGYVKVSADRNAWQIKSPNQTGVADIEIDGDSFVVDKTIVKGPTTGNDNRLLKSDGTNGRLLQESGITIDDSNNVSGMGTLGVSTVTSSADVDAVNVSVSGKFETSETAERVLTTDISGDITSSTVTITTLGYLDATSSIQTQLNTNATNISDHIGDASDAHAASAISNTPSGNLAATNQQAVNNELQTDIDTRATSADLTSHTGATIAHGTTSAIVGISDTQILTNKTIVIANNTVTATAGELNSVLSGLRTDVDLKATSADLATHLADTTAHGTTGNVVGTSDTQTLSNKTFSDPITLAELSGVISTPAAGFKKFYPKDDGKLYTMDSAGEEQEVGTGTGQGGINYIVGGDAEDGTTGYDRYADAAGTLPVDGTGGAPDAAFTFATQTSNILRGTNSFRITKDANDRQGHGVATEFTIDVADRAKKLVISFDYETSTDYADDDILISVWDENNAQIIRVNGENLKAGKGTHYAAFQTFSDSTIMRLIFHVSSTNAAAYTVDLDNIQVGPKNIVYGSPMTDKISFTPTGSWVTNSTYTGFFRRIGDEAEIEVKIALAGAPTATTLDINLPSGLVADTAKFANGITSAASNVGQGAIEDASAGDYYIFARLQSSTSVRILYLDASATQQGVTATAPMTFASGDSVGVTFRVPIVGWSSNAKMSEDFLGREIAVYVTGNSGQTISADTEDIAWINTSYDTTNSWSNAGTTGGDVNDAFTAPETGYYLVTGSILTTTTSSAIVSAYVNAVNTGAVNEKPGDGASERYPFSFVRKLNKGDILTLRTNLSFVLSSSISHWISINKLSSSQQVFETEECSARYTTNSGAAVTAGSPIIFEDLGHDTHSMFNVSTGVLTCAVSGRYVGSAKVKPNSSQAVEIGIEKNGTEVDLVELGTITTSGQIRFQVDLAKGDTLEVTNSAATSLTLTTTSANNVFEIARVK